MPLPPVAEQRRIVAEVERRLSVVDDLGMAVAANLRRAAGLRQAILKRAFEGKLVAEDPSDEPAGALLERVRSERSAAVSGNKYRAIGTARRTTARQVPSSLVKVLPREPRIRVVTPCAAERWVDCG